MLTVLIYDERLSSMITDYKPFWDPFLNEGEFALCSWRTQGRTVPDAVPDLYETVGDSADWRAVVLYHAMAPIGTNPFDFFEGSESAEEVENNDLIRLAHMLSTVPHKIQFMPVGVKEPRFAHVPDGILVTDEEADLTDAEENTPLTDKDFILDRELDFSSKNEDKDYYSFGDSNYELLCARPTKIILIATRRRNMSEEKLRSAKRAVRECSGGMQPIEGFCDRNDYPANIRFLVYDTWYASETMGTRDQFILLNALQTLLMNESVLSLRAEEVYRLIIQIDETELEKWLLTYQEKMTVIDNRIQMLRVYLREMRENRRETGELPDLTVNYYVDLSIDAPDSYEISAKNYRLFRDAPRPDQKEWQKEKAESHRALSALLKEPVRRLKHSLEGIRKTIKFEEQPVSGRFTSEMLEDASMQMEQLERGLFQSDATPAARLNEAERDELEMQVTAYIERRLSRPMALCGILLAGLFFVAGFIPYFCAAWRKPVAASEMAFLILVGLGILFAIWVLFLLLDRHLLRKKIRKYNTLINKVVDSYRALQRQYQEYVTKAFNYRKYWHFVRGLREEDDKFFLDEAAKAEVNLLRHKGAAQQALDLCARVRSAMDISDREMPLCEMKEPFTFSETPEQSGFYALDYVQRPNNPWADETAVYYGYPYLSGFCVRREEGHA